MIYSYEIRIQYYFYYSPKGSLACQEGGRQTIHLLREEKKNENLPHFCQSRPPFDWPVPP